MTSTIRWVGWMVMISFAACSDPTNASPDPPVHYEFAGEYVGTWTDAIGSFQFSLKVDSGDTTGQIWYSPAFSSCCGGGSSPDALFTMTVQGTTITSFSMTQYLADYPQGTGGHCPTTATATGSLVNNGTVFRLDPFFFSDCDGARTVTTFQLSKQISNQ